MSAANAKKKRPGPAQATTTTPPVSAIYNLLDCYEFLATNEYSEKTIGIQAFVTRKSVGDINFSEIIDDNEKRNRQGQGTNFIGLLEEKRNSLPQIDASVEKCLMLTRLINYIKEQEARFTSIVSDIRLEMQCNMADNQNTPYTYDVRKHQQEFETRKLAQEMRRLFYYNHQEAKHPPNLVYLQNKTTKHLEYIIEQMKRDSKFRQTGINELSKIFQSSFLIVAQPHSGSIPVTIYERRAPGEYTAKISVTIISLLYDFMQKFPHLIELFDIEPSLLPSSTYYKLEEPRSLTWKTCQVQTAPGGICRTFYYAELSAITIEQSSKTDTRVRFAQLLHSFKFAIKLQLHFADSKMLPVFQIPLESVRFGIGAHNNQIPQLLTRVIIDDIQRFSNLPSLDVKTILSFMVRYFIHRTGVRPNECICVYVEQELMKAFNQKSSTQPLEDASWEFLVNFVHQVEFMAKHPALAMFHADGLFLGICNSERAAEAIVQSPISGSPVIALRFNSIRIDYSSNSGSSVTFRTVKLPQCAVRVDIYNDRTKKLQNRTFDSTTLANDISKFVSSTHADNASRINVLSSFDDTSNQKKCSPFSDFAKYYNERLQQILKNDEKYKPVTNLVDNANDDNPTEEIPESQSPASTDLFPLSPNSLAPFFPRTPMQFDFDQSVDTSSVHDYMSIPYDGNNYNISSPQSVLSPPDRSQQQLQQQAPPLQQNPYVNNSEAIINYLRAQPKVAEEVIRRFAASNGTATTSQAQIMPQQPQIQIMPQQAQIQNMPQQAQIQNMPQQPQVQYQPQLVSYQPPSPIVVLPQRSPASATTSTISVPLQQPQYHTLYHQQQQQPQIYSNQPELRMPFQQSPIQAQYTQIRYQDQQGRVMPSVIHYFPNNAMPSTLSPTQPVTSMFPQQMQQFPTGNPLDMSSIFLEQINNLQLSKTDIHSPNDNSVQQQVLPTEVPIDDSLDLLD